MMSLPYENATSKAIGEIKRLLQKFGCQSFGAMSDFENGKLIVQFKYRGMPISVEASMKGYAAAWLKEHPWSGRMKRTKIQHERKALEVPGIAVHSILRD